MSTRCQIAFYDTQTHELPSALLYRHSDGYPDTPHGVIATLVPILRQYKTRRGFYDSEFCAAVVLHQWLTAYEQQYPDGLSGLGVSQELHGDIEYFYAVYDGVLVIYTPESVVDYASMHEVARMSW